MRKQRRNDEGFMLLAVIVLVFLVLLALSVAAPKIAMQLKREREAEANHRAQQYVRGIRVYYRKFNHYPGSVEQLVSSNNQKFLRAKYLDPLTGKDDWRLIHVGENKTKVKGFFGEDLPALGGGGTGLTSAGGTSTTSSNPLTTTPAPNTTGAASNPTSGTGGVGSVSATDFNGSGGGPIMGIGSSKTGEAIVTVNEQTNYQDWEFLYDPRIEEMYKKGNLLGGVNSGGLNSTPIGSGGLNSLGGGNGLNGTSGSGGSGGSGSGSGTGTGSGTGSTTPKQ